MTTNLLAAHIASIRHDLAADSAENAEALLLNLLNELELDQLKAQLEESENAYNTLTTLLRNRFPPVERDGKVVWPDFKIEDVIRENEKFRQQIAELQQDIQERMNRENELHVLHDKEIAELQREKDACSKSHQIIVTKLGIAYETLKQIQEADFQNVDSIYKGKALRAMREIDAGDYANAIDQAKGDK